MAGMHWVDLVISRCSEVCTAGSGFLDVEKGPGDRNNVVNYVCMHR